MRQFFTRICLFIIFAVFAINTQAQCPWSRANCKNGCGRFTDDNKNGFCDYSELQESKQKDTAKASDFVVKHKAKDNKTFKKVVKSKVNTDEIKSNVNKSNDKSLYVDDSIKKITIVKPNEAIQNNDKKGKPYSLIFISCLTVGLYVFSLSAIRLGLFKKRIHRRIWNILLLITFLASCLLGFFLVIQINYSIVINWYLSFLHWHVEFGIAMTIIAVIHIFWHLKYFKNILKNKK